MPAARGILAKDNRPFSLVVLWARLRGEGENYDGTNNKRLLWQSGWYIILSPQNLFMGLR